VSSLPPVRTGAPAVPARGVQVVVDKVRQVTVSAEGPGAVAGPGVSVEVRVTNGSGSALDLGGLAVNASYGDDATPAAPSDSPPARPLAGRLAPGAAAAGVYVFTVPRAEASSLRVDVSSDAWPGIVVVRR
jgi:hypothetical protein